MRLPIPLRLLLAAQPKLVTPVLQIVHRPITRHLLGQAGLKADDADSGAITLIQRFGSAANLNIHLNCLLLDGVYRRGTEGVPVFVEAPAPTDQALQAVLHKVITRLKTLSSSSAGGARPCFDHLGQGFLLEISLALDRGDDVGDQVGAARRWYWFSTSDQEPLTDSSRRWKSL